MSRLLALLLVILLPACAMAQGQVGPGYFINPDCTQIQAPVTNQTLCWNATTKQLGYYNGASYTYFTTAGGFPTLASQGGTGLDTSTWNGIPTVNAGVWTQNNTLVNGQILIGQTGNTVTSSPNLTYSGATLTLGGTATLNVTTADGYKTNNVALKNITETLSNKTIAAPVLSGTTTGTYTLGGTATIAGPTAIGSPASMGSAAAGDIVFPNGVGGIRFARQDTSGTSYALTFGTDDSVQLGLGSLVSNIKMFKNLNLRAGFLYGILTNSSAYTAIASTNVETFFGIGTDGQILAGGINAAKHRIEATFRGIYGVNGATDTITLKAKLCTVSGCGSGTVVQLAATGAVLPGVAVTNQGWEAKVDCNVFTAGVSGTLDCQGFSLFSLTGLTALQADDMVNTTTVTVDTTTDQFLSLSATWNNNSANNTIQLRNLGVKVY